MIVRSHRLAAGVLLAIAVVVPGVAGAQFASPADRQCIEAVNRGVRKVALASTKQLRACAGYAVAGLLGPQTVAECAAALVTGPVTVALFKADQACGGAPPTFGPPSITAPPGLAVEAGAAIVTDLFGAPPEGALSAAASIEGCQQNVLKAVQRCVDARVNQFNRCKREGLKRGFVRSAAELQDVCLGTGAAQPDPSGGTIAKFCTTQPVPLLQSRCVDKGVALEVAFPGCSAADIAGAAACFDTRIRCRVCGLLNAVDGLARDCDLFDDGDADNESCS